MLPRALSALFFLFVSAVAGPANAAEDWVGNVVDRTARLMNSHCVSRDSPNTLYLLNAPSGKYMPELQEKRAMSKLTEAFLDHGWFQVTRGDSLRYEAYMSENTAAGRRKLQDTLARLSNSTITIFFVPAGRSQSEIYADVVFLTRTNENGEVRLGCGPSITVDIPTTPADRPPPVSLEKKAEDFVVDYLALWSRPDRDFLSRIMSLYEEPVRFYDETRTLQGIYEEKKAFSERWPYRSYEFLPDMLTVSCDPQYCYVQANYNWWVSSPSRGEQKNGFSTLAMTLRVAHGTFKIVAEDGEVY